VTECGAKRTAVLKQILSRAKGLLRMARTLKCPSHFLDFVDLELVADLQVVEVFHGHAALETGFHFTHVVLEALQRIDLPRMNDHVFTPHAARRVAPHQAVEHHGSGGGSALGDLEALATVDAAAYGLYL